VHLGLGRQAREVDERRVADDVEERASRHDA
jgi:hypothetical protein